MNTITEYVLDISAVRGGENIGISPSTNRRVQPRKGSAVCHHLLNRNYLSTFEEFSVLCHENRKSFSELKETLIEMRDGSSMN